MQTALFENLPIQFNADVAKPDLPLFQLAECKARAKKQEDESCVRLEAR